MIKGESEMKCPFFIETSNGCYCELTEELKGGRRPIVVSASKCKSDGFIACPEFIEIMCECDDNDVISQDLIDLGLPGIRIGHVNRIGGPRALFEDLLQ